MRHAMSNTEAQASQPRDVGHTDSAASHIGGVSVATLARRTFLAASALALAGCATSKSATAELPDAAWPGGRYDDVPAPPRPKPLPAKVPQKGAVATADPLPPGGVIPRARWAKSGPDMGDINPMLPIRSLTIHHEGWEPFVTSDFDETAYRIEHVRIAHRNAKGGGYADIGYHYIVDREGRVWEGRSLKYQGAHVKNHNEGNIGIMCLGNFEEQNPTEKQLAGLARQVRAVMARHNIPIKRVYTHQEWKDAQTLCPGRSLQAWVMRNRPKSFA